MISLPPGCRVNYAITIDIDTLSDEIVEWFNMIGGVITEDRFYDSRGREQTVKYVQYGKAKKCHHHHNGSGGTRLHFHGDDVGAASAFLIKFNEHVTNHNMRDHETNIY